MAHSILIVEDDVTLASNIQTYLERKGYETVVCHNAEEALLQLKTYQPDILLTDNSLPGMSGLELIALLHSQAPQIKPIMMTGHGNIDEAVKAMQTGAFHYLTKPVALVELKLLLQKAMESQRIESKLSYYQSKEERWPGLEKMIGESPAMQAVKGVVRQLIDAERRMSGNDLPTVLIEGETGTGKEVVARALHYDGMRASGPFIELNCASIPSHLLEAELFGHERGAFTDAKERRVGLVEAADGGTLFLDEVGEMDIALQAKLLKLLEERTIRRIGSVKEIKVNLRVISATNCNLEQMVQQGRFRRDLFFRLRIISIKMPRLYARGDDIILLARHFLQIQAQRYGRSNLRFTPEAEALLRSYSWPGNVRELCNTLEQTVLLAQGNLITPNQLALCSSLIDEPKTTFSSPGHSWVDSTGDDMGSQSLPEVERELVIKMLNKTDWNVTKSARQLGLTRDMLRYRIDKLGLVRPNRQLS